MRNVSNDTVKREQSVPSQALARKCRSPKSGIFTQNGNTAQQQFDGVGGKYRHSNSLLCISNLKSRCLALHGTQLEKKYNTIVYRVLLNSNKAGRNFHPQPWQPQHSPPGLKLYQTTKPKSDHQ